MQHQAQTPLKQNKNLSSPDHLYPLNKKLHTRVPEQLLMSWDIQFWLTARVGHIQPLALNQPRILAQRRVTNFTWHSMTRALDPSTPLSGKQGQVLNAELSWVCLDFEHHHKQLFCLHSGKLGLGYTCIHQEVQVQHCMGFLDTWLKWKPQLSHNTNFQGADHKVGWN